VKLDRQIRIFQVLMFLLLCPAELRISVATLASL
jgi:hypothetical protein